MFAPLGNPVLTEGVPVALSLQDEAFALPPSPATSDLVRAWEGAVKREAERALDRVSGR
ncbi:hypothetical protein ACQPYE_20990 [Actinosynnema sp. CA-299493]